MENANCGPDGCEFVMPAVSTELPSDSLTSEELVNMTQAPSDVEVDGYAINPNYEAMATITWESWDLPASSEWTMTDVEVVTNPSDVLGLPSSERTMADFE